MAIISFALTAPQFVNGTKTVTRRDWSEKTLQFWQKWYDAGKLVHTAYDKNPRNGGKIIGQFQLTQRPFRQRIGDMEPIEFVWEGVYPEISTPEQFAELLGKTVDDELVVIRFRNLNDRLLGYAKLFVELTDNGATVHLTVNEELVAQDGVETISANDDGGSYPSCYDICPHEVVITCPQCNQDFTYKTKSNEWYFPHIHDGGGLSVSRIGQITSIWVIAPFTAVAEGNNPIKLGDFL